MAVSCSGSREIIRKRSKNGEIAKKTTRMNSVRKALPRLPQRVITEAHFAERLLVELYKALTAHLFLFDRTHKSTNGEWVSIKIKL